MPVEGDAEILQSFDKGVSYAVSACQPGDFVNEDLLNGSRSRQLLDAVKAVPGGLLDHAGDLLLADLDDLVTLGVFA